MSKKPTKELLPFQSTSTTQIDPQADFQLATLYLEKNQKKAARYYLKAAKKGHSQAQCIVGYLYLNGIGVAKNKRRSFKWFEAASKQGNPEALYNIACYYWAGYGVAKNRQQALKLFYQAFTQGSEAALLMYTKYYIFISVVQLFQIKGGPGSLLINWNWRQDYYDMQVHSKLVNKSKLEDLSSALFWVGNLDKKETNLIVASSLKELNEALISSDSPIIKTGISFAICRQLLDGLLNNQLGEIAPFVLTNLILNGMLAIILNRYLNTAGYINIGLSTNPESALAIRYIKIDKKGVEYRGFIPDPEEKIINSPTQGVSQCAESEQQKFIKLIGRDKIRIDAEEIETVVDKYLHEIPFDYFVRFFIPAMLTRQVILGGDEVKARFSGDESQRNHLFEAQCFYNAIKKPYLKAKDRILTEERQNLQNNLQKRLIAMSEYIDHTLHALPSETRRTIRDYLLLDKPVELSDIPAARFFGGV